MGIFVSHTNPSTCVLILRKGDASKYSPGSNAASFGAPNIIGMLMCQTDEPADQRDPLLYYPGQPVDVAGVQGGGNRQLIYGAHTAVLRTQVYIRA